MGFQRSHQPADHGAPRWHQPGAQWAQVVHYWRGPSALQVDRHGTQRARRWIKRSHCRQRPPPAQHGAVTADTPGAGGAHIPVVHHTSHPKGIARSCCATRVMPTACWATGARVLPWRRHASAGPVHHCMRAIGQVRTGAGTGHRARTGARPLVITSSFANLQDWPSRLEIDQARLLVLVCGVDAGSACRRNESTRCAPRWPPSRWWVARPQSRVVDRAMQILVPWGCHRYPTGVLLTWGRALHLMDGPDGVHLRTVACHELPRRARGRHWWSTSPRLNRWLRYADLLVGQGGRAFLPPLPLAISWCKPLPACVARYGSGPSVTAI